MIDFNKYEHEEKPIYYLLIVEIDNISIFPCYIDKNTIKRIPDNKTLETLSNAYFEFLKKKELCTINR
jgi:hypothetical protein